MKLSTIVKGAVVPFVGVAMLALVVRYFGDKPLIKDIKLGLKGDSTALFG